MIKYISRKEVHAEPMNELKAVELGYARANSDNHEWREGYHVLYPDGYHSWCPKAQFEKSNMRAETHIDRMFIERDDLDFRIKKLKEFLLTDVFSALPEEEQKLLRHQLGDMSAYLNVLDKRLTLKIGNEPCCCNE